jgi:5-methylcytosine-specific restriction endonuclease McrA
LAALFDRKNLSLKKYTFKLDGLRRKHSKPEIVASLRRYAEQHGVDTVQTREYDSWRERILCTLTICEIFGSWGKALQSAGLRSRRVRRVQFREMVDAFKACWKEHDAPPSRRQLEAFLEKNKYPFRWASYRSAYGGHLKLSRLIIAVQAGRIPESTLYKRVRPTSYRKPVSPKLRIAVLKRDHYRCVKCGADPEKDRNVRLEADHIIPVSIGGQSVMNNLQTLCNVCNGGKSNGED